MVKKSTLPTSGRNYLNKNEKFMRKRSDEVFDKIYRESISENLQKLNEVQISVLKFRNKRLTNQA